MSYIVTPTENDGWAVCEENCPDIAIEVGDKDIADQIAASLTAYVSKGDI